MITKALTTQQSQCKRNRSRSESGERAGKKGEDGKFTLLVEKSEKSNEFGVTVKETDTEYPVITAVQKGKFEVFGLKSMTVLSSLVLFLSFSSLLYQDTVFIKHEMKPFCYYLTRDYYDRYKVADSG